MRLSRITHLYPAKPYEELLSHDEYYQSKSVSYLNDFISLAISNFQVVCYWMHNPRYTISHVNLVAMYMHMFDTSQFRVRDSVIHFMCDFIL